MSNQVPEETLSDDRRDFCKLSCSALAMLAIAGAAGAANPAYAGNTGYSPPVPLGEGGLKQVPDTKAGLSSGQVKDYRKLGNFFLVADPKGIYAMSSLCTHAGCSVHLAGTAFDCPCHGSGFDLGGAVTQGPAKLPLKHFEVHESTPGGPLVVDLGKTVASDARL